MGYKVYYGQPTLELKQGIDKEKVRSEYLKIWEDRFRGMYFDDYGGVWFNQPDQYWDDGEFFHWLAKYVREGYIDGSGEDHEHFRFFFDGKGNLKFFDGNIYFGDIYHEFLSVYKEKITPDLKKDLERWWGTLKI